MARLRGFGRHGRVRVIGFWGVAFAFEGELARLLDCSCAGEESMVSERGIRNAVL